MSENELRRNSWQLLKDILVTAQSGAIKTHLVYRANSNFKELKEYLSLAIKAGLLIQDGDHYYTTTKGEEFVARVLDLELILSG